MAKNDKYLISFIISILLYSLAGFAYINSNFMSKDIGAILLKNQERIENKVDKLLQKDY